ncbi:Tetraspanin family protein [Tritrichomonas foetus]|uniref:Tetraspanin family protein n=1 Tax=Tritrichomonas foetus TaxID=1144522 RepID=A0A1J4JUQ7_9EUKA|nr:Tetraspanin family protein [Tritrichomonas foetus]|eukprot:OHT02208.1 Tetraspanin family protein [Tritrichomonas foetus]
MKHFVNFLRMKCCRKRKFRRIRPEEEKSIISKIFIVFMVFQTLLLLVLCGITIYYLYQTNVQFFLQVDLLSLIIAVVILGILILVIGWSSAISNNWLLWVLFHIFMFILLIVEMLVSWYSSDVQNFLGAANHAWSTALEEDISEIEEDLQCCGYINATDRPVDCSPGWENGCITKLTDLMLGIRNTASVALFVDFVFTLFIDFMGCAICFHPEFITFEDLTTEAIAGPTTESYHYSIKEGENEPLITHRKQ